MAPLLMAPTSLPAPAEPAAVTRSISWTPDTCVQVAINGASLRLAISTADPVAVYLNPDAAARAGLAARGLDRLFGLRYRIGPDVAFEGRSRIQTFTVADHPPEKAEVIWFETDRINVRCDGYISVWLLAAPRISLLQPDAPPSTRDITIAMTPNRQRIVNYHGEVEVGGRIYFTQLDLGDSDTQTNATAAAELSDAGKLALTGDFRMHKIKFGVERPVERAEAVGWTPYGLPVPVILVRREHLGATPPPNSASSDNRDPDEVAPVVINGRKSPQTRYAWITLGYKALARCRSLTFDRASHTVTLACAD